MKAEVRICFYNSIRLQGWRKYVIGLMQWTEHTHVHLELRFNAYKLILITVDGSKPRVVRLGLNKKLFGVDPYAQISMGIINLKEDAFEWVLAYPETHHWALIWYQILRYFNKEDKINIPPTCTTFVIDFLNVHHKNFPRLFSPKQLWRYLYDGSYDWR